MIAAYILTLDSGDDTDLYAIADDVKTILDGQQGLIVVDCKPWQHPVTAPQPALGAPTPQTPSAVT